MTILADQAAKALYAAAELAPLHAAIFRIAVSHETDLITPSLRAKQILYRFRQEIGDPELLKLQIHLSPDDPDHEIWIVKAE